MWISDLGHTMDIYSDITNFEHKLISLAIECIYVFYYTYVYFTKAHFWFNHLQTFYP